jgi:glucose-6-phosphate 1-dehydrogenase
MAQNLPSTSLFIFGVSGDLSKRYLLPALAEICRNSDIRAKLRIVGLSRRDVKAADILPQSAGLSGQFEVLQMDYQQPGEYQKLKGKINRLGSDQAIFYFAVPPQAVLPIIDSLGKAKLNGPNIKLLLESPSAPIWSRPKK